MGGSDSMVMGQQHMLLSLAVTVNDEDENKVQNKVQKTNSNSEHKHHLTLDDHAHFHRSFQVKTLSLNCCVDIPAKQGPVR